MAKANKNQPIRGIWTMLGVAGFVLLILLCVAMIAPARKEYVKQLKLYEQIQSEVERKRAERDALQKEVTDLESSPAAIEKVARETFHYCREGEIIIYHE